MPVAMVTKSGFRLGLWHRSQRNDYRKGILSQERIEALEAAGVVWDPSQVAWEEGLEQFLKLEPDQNGWQAPSALECHMQSTREREGGGSHSMAAVC